MYYVVGHGPEMRGLVLEPESSDSGSNEPVQQNAENDDQGDLFQTEGSSEKESSSDETGSETTDEYVNRVREEMITNPESVGETEPEQEAESTSANKLGGISEALENQNVEHRLNDIATECHWMLENVEKIGGIPDAE